MLQHRAEVIDCADICNIGTVLSLDKAQRSAFDDAVTGVAEEEVGVGIKVDTVILSQVHILRNPIDLQKAANHNIRTAQSSDIKSDSPTDDPNSQRILLKWPHNFLGTLGKTQNWFLVHSFAFSFLGLTAEEAGGTGQLRKLQMQTLASSNERRSAEDKLFLLRSFDQQWRGETNASVSVKINTRDNRTAEFIELVNSERFDEKLRVATEDIFSNEASELKKSLLPLI